MTVDVSISSQVGSTCSNQTGRKEFTVDVSASSGVANTCSNETGIGAFTVDSSASSKAGNAFINGALAILGVHDARQLELLQPEPRVKIDVSSACFAVALVC